MKTKYKVKKLNDLDKKNITGGGLGMVTLVTLLGSAFALDVGLDIIQFEETKKLIESGKLDLNNQNIKYFSKILNPAIFF